MSNETDLGPCCICGSAGYGVRNVMMLHFKNQVPGHGWGCVVCGLPPDGAVAVLCDPCFDRLNAGEATLKFVCRGYPATEGRIPFPELTVPHDHNMEIEH